MLKNKFNYLDNNFIDNKKSIYINIAVISLILILISIFGFASCAIKETQQPSDISNVFDAREIKPGDTVAGIKVEFVDIEPGPEPSNEDNYFAIVKFSGKLELSGKYISYSDQPLLGRSIIFYPDKESAKLIPRLAHVRGEEIWIVFENYNEAAELLSKPDSEGTAMVIIDNYTINYSLEAVNTGEIIEVLERDITKTKNQQN